MNEDLDLDQRRMTLAAEIPVYERRILDAEKLLEGLRRTLAAKQRELAELEKERLVRRAPMPKRIERLRLPNGFYVGQRVCLTDEAKRAGRLLLQTRANGRGTVVGGGATPLSVRVRPDTYKTVISYSVNFWKPDEPETKGDTRG